MSDTGGIVNVDVALRRQVDALTLRFPDVDQSELEQLVHRTYDRLKDDAAVESHLVSMTEGQVTDELRRRGEEVHVRSEDAAD